ncbi:ABC transporter permease [Sedimentibacter hydroxybenzoicus DSM 7310]|uniref:ABC transporter permease n=1 Tax=Sedimentibacter hydroxybenzoicus DSM 7310 TaxID=1123245 RepID=A0A974GY18_SEDHY|nr:ABC transporter permease [Sedimentibacter hydroxybenzoicus]NYB76148.1 ABC transporter permease [Sedimentibacter hydroxybenzoicus DSM 7310]
MNNSPTQERLQVKGASWLADNLVTIIFILFTIFGFMVSDGVSLNYFLTELSSRFFRNAFLVLSLIIPVVAGLGLNFGIVVGAMAGQIAIAIVRYFNMGGISGMMLTLFIAFPIAALFGYFTGLLYNKTRGQEMIASLIVGYFANGLYQFLFLFVVGVIIKVPATHPMIKPDGVGIRMTVDLVALKDGGLKYALDNILQMPFMWAVLAVAAAILLLQVIRYVRNNKKPTFTKNNRIMTYINIAICLILIGVSVHAITTKSSLMMVRKVPVVTGLMIIGLCIFSEKILSTKLGQDFRSVGQSQHIAEVSGINVDRTRLIATMISTVLAAWGQIMYMQNMGTLNTYGAHTQIGMFSVASLLVGGASTQKANIRHAILGTLLFNSMFIMSPEIGKSVFGNALLGEYFRTFMVYGVIGLALGLHVWRTNKKEKITLD